MLWALAEDTSVSTPVAVSRSYTVVSVAWLVEFVVSNVVVNVVSVARLVEFVVSKLVSNVVVVDALVELVVLKVVV